MAKKYDHPTSLEGLSLEELSALRTEAQAEIAELNAADDENFDLDRVEALLANVTDIDTASTAMQAEADALAARRQAARDGVAALDETPADGGDEGGEGDPAPEGDPATEGEPAAVDATVDAGEPVLASGTRKPTVAAASRKAPAVIIPKDKEDMAPTATILASANVPEFNQGADLSDKSRLTEAFINRVGAFGVRNPAEMKSGYLTASHQKFGVATITRPEREYSVNKEMSLEKQWDIILAAGNEKSALGQSLTAAGGWCAPSETIYSMAGYETAAGLIDLPEVTARRGGISFTKGPDFMTVYADADAGFIQTETQAEAGTEKPCFALDCPPFTEVRLDAIGFCATAPLLTEAAFPELVRRVLDLLQLGHQRRKSASTIARIKALMAAPVTFAPVSVTGSQSGIADALSAAELRADQIRQSLAMDPNATIEGIAPWWARHAWRSDLSRRLGLADPFRISDADIDQYFAVRNIRFQYVYDYQDLAATASGTFVGTATWTAWPTTMEFMLYPAGAYTRLVNDVANLTAVYDHELLTHNEYTAAFMEEGIAVANTRGFGLRTTVALNYEGAAGFPAIGAGSGVTFAAA